MKRIVAFALFLALIVMAGGFASVHAEVHAEAGAGLTTYVIGPNGVWYQVGAPDNVVRPHGRAFEVGITDSYAVTDNYGLAWHIDYVNLGHVRSYCQCTTIDADYNGATGKIAPGAPLATYSGNGLVQGFKASISPYVRIGSWRVGINDGIFVYRPQFTDSVYGWHSAQSSQLVNGYVTTPTRRQFAPVVGMFISRGKFTLSYDYYRMNVPANESNAPPLWSGAHVLMVSYAF